MADDNSSENITSPATIGEEITQLIYPQNQLISVKLTEANYLIWKTQVTTAIKGYGLEDFINLQPRIPDQYVIGSSQLQVTNPSFTLWTRQDQILASWILSSLSENILPLMIGLSSSSEIWNVLETNFASQSKAKTLQYKLQLQTTRKGNLSMREYLAKIKMCCDLLATTGNPVSQNDHIMHILSGLGSEYDPVMVTVTAGINAFSLNDIQALLLSFEARLEGAAALSSASMVNQDASLPTVNYAAPNQRRSFNPRGRGSYTFRGRGNRGATRGRGGRFQGNRVTCQVCHISGHTADRCWHRFDQTYGIQGGSQTTRGNNDSQNKNPTLNMVQIPGSSNDEGWWFPDSGASNHVTNDFNNLQSASEYNGSNRLQMGNGNNEQISHIGNSILHSNQSSRCFYLKDLLHVPSITKKLISVSKFALDNNVYFEFHPSFCVVKDQDTQEVLLKGELKEGLYRFNLDHSRSARNKELAIQNNVHVLTVSGCNLLNIELWHKRLGHSSYNIVKKALRSSNIPFDNKNHCDSKICSSCALAKGHKLPFNASESQSNSPFDLVHTDLWGPAPIQSVNGYKYYVSYIDDYSKFTWIYLLKLKSEVNSTFVHFHKFIETQYKTKIKAVQSDGGTEYKPLFSFFKDEGILHRISCPYTPQQNGCAERKHMHIVEMALSLLAESNMPLKYWDDAFVTATYLINRVPAKTIQYLSPLEKLTKQKPDYSTLKVFGCLAYPYTRPYNQHKLQYRSVAGVFLGYSPQYKGYKILLSSGKVMITRHVLFQEDCFPFLNSNNEESSEKQNLNPIFISNEPTVATFPTFLQDNQPQTPASSSHNTQNNHESPETVPLRAYLPFENSSQNFENSQHSDNGAPSVVDLQSSSPDNSPSITQRNQQPTNQHPMLTRAKAGVFKPKILSAEVTDDLEPRNAKEALTNSVWRKAMKEEYEALLRNKTWTLTFLPKGANVVGCRWVFKVKRDAEGKVERHKARLVAQGYTQTPGCDFHETFSPVVKPTTIRVMLSVALAHSWKVKQLDVSNAFLNGELTEEIYMRQPEGFEKENGQVCRLNKALYGLKQASRAWYTKVKETLSNFGFVNSKADNSLFLSIKGGVKIFVLIYVDDILITGSSDEAIQRIIEKLKQSFSVKDLGEVHHFLGIEVSKVDNGLHLCQREYIRKLLSRAKMEQTKSCPTPMVTSVHLSKFEGDQIKDASMYRSIVGALHYVTITRPEIYFAVSKVSQFMANPLEPHWRAVKRILRYLAGTLHYGLKFQTPHNLNVVGFSDSDWGADVDDRRSVSGYCVYVGGNLVSWSSKKQHSVSRSSTEAEYRSLAQVIYEISWIRYLLAELKEEQKHVPRIWIDNQSAIYLSYNPILHARTKHIELDYHFVREKVAAGLVQVDYVPSIDQKADILTKALSIQFFARMRSNLTVVPHPKLELRGSKRQGVNLGSQL